MKITYSGAAHVAGSGTMRLILGTQPGAGAEVSETVPAGKIWRVVAFLVSLVTNATVATRTAEFAIDDGSGNIFSWGQPQLAQSASLTFPYILAAGVNPAFPPSGVRQGNSVHVATPGLSYLLPGYRIRTVSTNLQAGDQYGQPKYQVEEWPA